MNGLAIAGMIGWFVLAYLIAAVIVLLVFLWFEWHRLGQPDEFDFHVLRQIVQSLVKKPVVLAFLMPFIWFANLWLRNEE